MSLEKVKPIFSMALTILKDWRTRSKEKFRNLPWHKKVLSVFLKSFIAFIIFLFLVDINFLWLFGHSPSLRDISRPQQNIASEIYSQDNIIIGKYFRENRSPVKYENIAPIMIKTLVSTEDERFYDHFGIDIQGVFAAIKDMLHGKARGASTITQQLVKNMYNTRSGYSKGLFGYIPGVKLIIMKAKEWITAVKIEMYYSKREILTMYLNTVDFGSNAYGIKTAAKTYYNTTPNLLTTEQAATLVGLLKATTTYNPKINPKNSLRRRNVVLENLYTHKIINKHQLDSLKEIPVQLDFKIEQNYDGKALYFREAVVEFLKDWCKENDIDLYADGLKIYTTINSRMQVYAENAVQKQMQIVQRNFNNHWRNQEPWQDEKHQVIPGFVEDIIKRTKQYKDLKAKYDNNQDSIWAVLNKPHNVKLFDYKRKSIDTIMSSLDSARYMNRFMHTGFVAIEPQTGHIKAWVGDIDFSFWKYDKVMAKRQPGSTFKLFVYAEAFNQGMGPCDEITESYIDWDYMENGEKKHWVPRNANGNYSGDTVTLKYAFARSFNSIAVKVAKKAGIENIINTAYKMGIKTPLNHIPSVCLGSSDVSLLELVNSYCTVVNDGKMHDPILVTKIEDKDGKVIYNATTNEKEAIPYETSFLMIQMLRAGLTEPLATSQAMWAFDIQRSKTDFGGKTGTSSNHSDAWYVGVTPKLVAGAWVGGEHRCVHFRTGHLGEGSKTALPIFGYFMEKVLKDQTLENYRARFPNPKQEITKDYMCQTPYPVSKDTTETEVTADTTKTETKSNIESDSLYQFYKNYYSKKRSHSN